MLLFSLIISEFRIKYIYMFVPIIRLFDYLVYYYRYQIKWSGLTGLRISLIGVVCCLTLPKIGLSSFLYLWFNQMKTNLSINQPSQWNSLSVNLLTYTCTCQYVCQCVCLSVWLFMAALRSRCGHYIFVLFFLSSFFIPRLISAVADWMSTILRHMMWS